MATVTLRLRARGSALVQDHEALIAGVRRFIGRRWQEVAPASGDAPARFGFVPTNETVEKTLEENEAAEYVHDLKNDTLWPGDQATADYAGVPFDPSFGEAPKPKAAKTTTAAPAPDAKSAQEGK